MKKTAMQLLTAAYDMENAAARDIPSKLTRFYQATYPDVYSKRSSEIAAASRNLLAIYNRNAFPDLKVTWGTFPNNLGHMDTTGCLPLP